MDGSNIAAVIGVLVAYFLPSLVALTGHKRGAAGVVVLNLLLGWTVLGWIGALVWAAGASRETRVTA